MNDDLSKILSIINQLEDVQQDFLGLIEAVPDQAWDSHIKGEKWTIKQEMVHIVQVVRVISEGLIHLSTNDKIPLLSLVPARIRSWINCNVIVPIKAKDETKESVMLAYIKAHEDLILVISSLSQENLGKKYPFPKEYRTLSQIATRPIEHYEEHKAHILELLVVWKDGAW